MCFFSSWKKNQPENWKQDKRKQSCNVHFSLQGEKEQPVFAVTGLRWGSYRDAEVKASK